MPLRVLLSMLAPPRCPACSASCSAGTPVCRRCQAWLEATGPPPAPDVAGLDAAWAAAPHDGVARELVTALKFRSLAPLAGLMAQRIAGRAPAELLTGAVVPVPPSPSRMRRRGFDPAEEIAGRLAALAGLSLRPCLRRSEGPRQVGRSRAARLASPPTVRSIAAAPREALLVDDVLTTGATLCACAHALRRAGSEGVSAVTFALTPYR